MRFFHTRSAASLIPAAAALAGLGLLAPAPAAHASTIVSLSSAAADTGGTRFTYSAAFDYVNSPGLETVTLEAGDFFTIYDFAGLASGSNLQPANWAFSSALTGITPANINGGAVIGGQIVDDPTVANLTWTYTGPSVTADTVFTGFSALSEFGGTRFDYFSAQNTQTITGLGVFAQANISRVIVPAAVPVPEPSEWVAMGMAGTSVGGLMVRARRKSRRRASA
jgi:uncharacterized membrane protein